MCVAELLMSQHRWGHTRARRFLAGVPMTETKTIGSMTERQRQSLADMLAAQSSPARAATASLTLTGDAGGAAAPPSAGRPPAAAGVAAATAPSALASVRAGRTAAAGLCPRGQACGSANA